MKKVTATWIAAGLVAGGIAWAADPSTAPSDLAKAFQSPPASAKPHTFWYWMDGHITREGIDADLEAMKRVGIGGVELYTIAGHGLVGKVANQSPEWWALLKHAIARAGTLGLEVDLNNSPQGWSSTNGPWITPEMSMQVLTWSETRVRGGQPFAGSLAQPKAVNGYYRDIAVVAFPTPELDANSLPKPAEVTGSGKDFKGEWLVDNKPTTGCDMPVPESKSEKLFFQLSYAQPVTARSLNMAPLGGKVVRGGKLLVSDDNITWREVAKFSGGSGGSTVMVLFPPITARYWQVVFERSPKLAISEVTLGDNYRILNWTGKAKYNLSGLDKPKFTPAELDAPPQCRIQQDAILDLTSKMDASGKLSWTPPPGDWTVLRFGHTNNGMVKPATKNGWLECDKFDRAAMDLHWSNFEKPLFDDPEIGPHIQYVHIDSYEAGAQNWTKKFPEEFKRRCGYDLTRYLPVFTGRVVDGAQTSERFLWDFRQVCDQLIVDNYFGYFQKLCHRAGKLFSLEGYNLNQFHCATIAGQGDLPMTEFWPGPNPAPGFHLFFKNGSSPGHLNGRQIVGAEAFTANGVGGGNYTTDPWHIKPLGDSAFCAGVNRYVYSLFVHQPWLNQAPGATLDIYGTHFERTNTWFEQMKGFNSYVSRCQYLLQQGQFIADLVYSYGENTPNDLSTHTLASKASPVLAPCGYDYDLCAPGDILNRMTVQDGKIIVPGSMVYRLLVLSEDREVTPAMVRKIGELVRDGAVVIGVKPQCSPSLIGQPNADAEVAKLAEEIWGDCDGKKATEHAYGKGRVIWGKPVKSVLDSLQVVEDFDGGALQSPIRYIHRKINDGELYFVANTASAVQAVPCKFRVSGMTPELWDPVTGEIRALPEYRQESGRTAIPLKFEPRQSYFVVFRGKAQRGQGAEAQSRMSEKNFPEVKPMMEVAGPWEVAFDPKWGGPAHATFPKLEDWTQRTESGIKYYSGKATYRKVFDLPAEFSIQNSTSKMFVDLGVVKNLAEVRLNGKDLGVVWCAPWRVEVTGLLKAKGNILEIDIVNLWVNRMIGDEQLPDDCEWGKKGGLGEGLPLKKLPSWLLDNTPRTSGRYTFCFWKHWTKTDPLLPSGLLGPVRLMHVE